MAIPLGNLEHTELRGCRPLFSRSRSFTVTLGASSRRRNRTVGYKGNRLSCPPLLSATPFYPNIHHFQSQPHKNQLTYSSPILSLNQDAIHRRPRSSPDLASRHGSPNVWHYVGYRWGPPTRLVQGRRFLQYSHDTILLQRRRRCWRCGRAYSYRDRVLVTFSLHSTAHLSVFPPIANR